MVMVAAELAGGGLWAAGGKDHRKHPRILEARKVFGSVVFRRDFSSASPPPSPEDGGRDTHINQKPKQPDPEARQLSNDFAGNESKAHQSFALRKTK